MLYLTSERKDCPETNKSEFFFNHITVLQAETFMIVFMKLSKAEVPVISTRDQHWAALSFMYLVRCKHHLCHGCLQIMGSCPQSVLLITCHKISPYRVFLHCLRTFLTKSLKFAATLTCSPSYTPFFKKTSHFPHQNGALVWIHTSQKLKKILPKSNAHPIWSISSNTCSKNSPQ